MKVRFSIHLLRKRRFKELWATANSIKEAVEILSSPAWQAELMAKAESEREVLLEAFKKIIKVWKDHKIETEPKITEPLPSSKVSVGGFLPTTMVNAFDLTAPPLSNPRIAERGNYLSPNSLGAKFLKFVQDPLALGQELGILDVKEEEIDSSEKKYLASAPWINVPGTEDILKNPLTNKETKKGLLLKPKDKFLAVKKLVISVKPEWKGLVDRYGLPGINIDLSKDSVVLYRYTYTSPLAQFMEEKS